MFSFFCYEILFCFTLCLYVFCLYFWVWQFKGNSNTKILYKKEKSCPSITISVIEVLEIFKSMSKSSICLAFWYTCRLHFVFSPILFICLISLEENMTILLSSVLHPPILFITLLLWILLVLGRRGWRELCVGNRREECWGYASLTDSASCFQENGVFWNFKYNTWETNLPTCFNLKYVESSW